MNMQSFKLFAMATILSVSAVIVSAAAPVPNSVRIEVPFEFQIGDKVFEAGQYRFARLSTRRLGQPLMIMQNLETGRETRILGVIHNYQKQRFNTIKVTFNKYGNARFLRSVNSFGTVFDISRSGAEKRVKKAGDHQLERVVLTNEQKS